MELFHVKGPTVISVSGGRTSGYMLRRILDAHDGVLPNDTHVLFANTGKEREETLAFVRDCALNFGVPIAWLERAAGGGVSIVDFATASRKGEPFAALIREKKYLPNPVTRFCTVELKIRVMKKYMRSLGYEHWTSVIGLRADEPSRALNALAPQREHWTNAVPLYRAGVSKADVDAYWKASPFDLQLQSYEGNCDLCFLKGYGKRLRIMQENPFAADWWIKQEEAVGATFRNNEPSYKATAAHARRQLSLPIIDDEPGVSCACTD